jgi:hypothetical protein
MALSPEEIKAIQGINQGGLTPDELNAIKKINNNSSSAWEKSGLAIKAGAEETLAGIGRIANEFGFPDWLLKGNIQGINEAIQGASNKSQQQFEQTNPNLAEQALEGATHYGTAAIATGGGEAGAEAALIKIFGKLAKVSPEAAKKLAQIVQKNAATKFAAKTAKTIPSGTAFGAVTASPDESLKEGATIGAIANPVGSSLFSAAGAGLKGLTKFNAIKKMADATNTSIEELKQALKDLTRAGAQEPSSQLVGNVINNPEVNKLETNTLPTTAGFRKKAVEKLVNTGSGLVNDANQLMGILANDMDKEAISDELQNLTVNHVDKLEGESVNNYRKANKEANSYGFQVDQRQYKKQAKQLYDELSKLSTSSGVNRNSQLMEEMRSIYETAPDFTDLQSANLSKSDWGDDYYKSVHSGDRKAARRYLKLQQSLRQSIQDSIDKSGNDDLKELYNHAESFYKENIVPLKEKDIAGIVTGKKDPDTITNTYLPLSGKGRLNLLKKFIKNAPNSEKLLMADRLSGAIEQNSLGKNYTNPDKLLTILNNIGDDRLKILIKDPNTLNLIKQFRNNMKNGSEAMQMMFNPKTGYANVANTNLYATMKMADEMLNSLAKGDIKSAFSKGVAASSNLAKFRAVNDPQLLQKIIYIKTGKKVPMGTIYRAGQFMSNNGVTFSQALTQAINEQS